MAANHRQETYVHARDSPFFKGMRRGEAAIMNNASYFTLNVKVPGEIARTASDVGSRRSGKIIGQVLENPIYSPAKSSLTANALDPSYGRSSSERWSRTLEATPSLLSDHPSEPTPSPLLDSLSELKFEDVSELDNECPPQVLVANHGCNAQIRYAKPTFEKSYSVYKRRTTASNVPLPPSAALFYIGHSPQMEVVESCESICRLNIYLKARKDDVIAGVPGKFLHAVIGPDICDVGSVASTIMYAFYLNERRKNSQFCVVPVINMKRKDMNSCAELKWLFDSCHVDQSSLVFLDEIDLSYYDIFGSLNLVLLNCNKLPAKQEALKDSLVEIFSCRKHEKMDVYPWVENITLGEEASCCTHIAEKFLLTLPEILSGQGFARLLLSGILLDTGNLRNPQTTSKDKYMATLLINGAGRFGCNGLYQILRYKMYDVADLRVGEILQKNLKKWTKTGKLNGRNSRMKVSNIGMTSIGMPIAQLLSLDSASNVAIIRFQRSEKLSLLVVVTGYLDTDKNFKREILVSATSGELLKKLILFIKSNAHDLPLEALHHPDLRGEMKAFETKKVTSRKAVERVLQEYAQISK